MIALATASPFASAAAIPRSWTGATNSDWITSANWSPSGAPLDGTRSAVFDTAFANQPTIAASASVLAIGGIWVKGTNVGNIDISVSGGTRTFQTQNAVDDSGTGVLIESGTTGKLTINTTSFKVGAAQSWINDSANDFTINAAVNVNALALTIKGSGNTVINGATSNGGAFTKEGAGTLTLATATHGHTGTTTVSAGTLRVTSELSSSTAVVNVNGGSLEGTGKIGRVTTIASGGTLAPGIGNTSAGTLTIDRNLTLGGAADFDLLSASSYDKVMFNSLAATSRTLTFGGTLKVDAAGATFASG